MSGSYLMKLSVLKKMKKKRLMYGEIYRGTITALRYGLLFPIAPIILSVTIFGKWMVSQALRKKKSGKYYKPPLNV